MPEIEPPKLENLERKLQILPNEWYKESYYMSDEVAAFYSQFQPTEGPFIIVPSFAKLGFQSDFVLTIFSSNPVEVQQLDASKNAVVSGKWTEKSAGGCHLNDKEFEQKPEKFTWASNPRFHLTLKTQEKAPVRITLSRPQKAWKKQVGMNLVGCMIGLYVFPSTQQLAKENILNKEHKFVPWNQVRLEITLDGNPDGYIIMPATYESGKVGMFTISVTTDVEFALREMLE